MKAILLTVLVSTTFVAGAVWPVAAQQFDPAVLDATAARLNLTDTQRVAALPVLEAGILERQQILKDVGFESGKKPNLRQLLRVRDPLRASRARTESELSGILSPEQMPEYREIVEELRQKIRAGRQ